MCDFMLAIPGVIKFEYLKKTYIYVLMCKYDLAPTTDKNIMLEMLPSYENKLRSLDSDRKDLYKYESMNYNDISSRIISFKYMYNILDDNIVKLIAFNLENIYDYKYFVNMICEYLGNIYYNIPSIINMITNHKMIERNLENIYPILKLSCNVNTFREHMLGLDNVMSIEDINGRKYYKLFQYKMISNNNRDLYDCVVHYKEVNSSDVKYDDYFHTNIIYPSEVDYINALKNNSYKKPTIIYDLLKNFFLMHNIEIVDYFVKNINKIVTCFVAKGKYYIRKAYNFFIQYRELDAIDDYINVLSYPLLEDIYGAYQNAIINEFMIKYSHHIYINTYKGETLISIVNDNKCSTYIMKYKMKSISILNYSKKNGQYCFHCVDERNMINS